MELYLYKYITEGDTSFPDPSNSLPINVTSLDELIEYGASILNAVDDEAVVAKMEYFGVNFDDPSENWEDSENFKVLVDQATASLSTIWRELISKIIPLQYGRYMDDLENNLIDMMIKSGKISEITSWDLAKKMRPKNNLSLMKTM